MASKHGLVESTDLQMTAKDFETQKEKFLDQVFDTNSRLKERDFVVNVATKADWLFNPELLMAEIKL